VEAAKQGRTPRRKLIPRNLISRNLGWTLLAVCLLSSSCTKKAPPPGPDAQVGTASWYGVPFDGRLTASGEIYDMQKLTAAHRTLPFGTVLRVESTVNRAKVEVRINDRGPFVPGRIIDLSRAAAQAISMSGTAIVRLEIISTPPTRAAEQFVVQTGAFPQRQDADRLRQQMQQEYGTARLVFRKGDQTWRVLVGLEPTIESANLLAQKLDKEAGPASVVADDSE
jgi:rare lipoprotein A